MSVRWPEGLEAIQVKETPLWKSSPRIRPPVYQSGERRCVRWKHSPESVEELLRTENFLDLLCLGTLFFHDKKPSVNDLIVNRILAFAKNYEIIPIKTFSDYKNIEKLRTNSIKKPIAMIDVSDAKSASTLLKSRSRLYHGSLRTRHVTLQPGLWIRGYISKIEDILFSAFDGLFLFDTSDEEFETIRKRIAISQSMVNAIRNRPINARSNESVIFFWNYEKNDKAPLLDSNPRVLGVSSNGSNPNPNKIEVNIMSDYKNYGQVGAMGDHAKAENITFTQIGSQIEKSIDLAQLADELSKLRQTMKQEATTPEHDIAISDIARAEQAARSKDSSKVAEHLKSAGKWAFDFASKVGAALVAEAMKHAMGMK